MAAGLALFVEPSQQRPLVLSKGQMSAVVNLACELGPPAGTEPTGSRWSSCLRVGMCLHQNTQLRSRLVCECHDWR